MKRTNLCAAVALTVSLAACGGMGGPSATAEGEQSASAATERSREWAREDLVVRSSSSNITVPAPGMVAKALAEVGTHKQETGEQPLEMIFAAGAGSLDHETMTNAMRRFYSPSADDLKAFTLSPEAFSKLVNDTAAAGAEGAARFESFAGPLAAAILWPSLAAGDRDAFNVAIQRFELARQAARWCATPGHNIKGWPVNAMSNAENDRYVVGIYVRTVERATASCANLVAKILADLGPIAYADPAALKVAVYQRLAAFTTAELTAMADLGELESVTLDLSGFQGQAWNSKRGRFENAGDGWVWKTGGLVQWGPAHVYGREMNVQLASMASGTQRRTVTSNQAISAEARQRAAAAVQAGNPAGG